MVTSYVEIPTEAPQPTLWKSLGQVLPGLFANYAITRWGDDLDVDREADLRVELNGILRSRAEVRDGERWVRYADRLYPELLIQLVIVNDTDHAALTVPAKRRN